MHHLLHLELERRIGQPSSSVAMGRPKNKTTRVIQSNRLAIGRPENKAIRIIHSNRRQLLAHLPQYPGRRALEAHGFIIRRRVHNRVFAVLAQQKIDGRIALAVRALGGADGHVVLVDSGSAGGDVVAADGALEDGEGGEGLVVGDFVAGVVDAGEGEGAALLGLAVDGGGVRGGDVDVAGGRVARDADGVVDGFAAEPVAWFPLLVGSVDVLTTEAGSTYCCSLRLRIAW